MKLASAITFVGMLLSGAALLASEQIPWVADFQTACGMAAEQHRLVLLHFYSDNCTWCVRLDQNVFSKPAVAEAVAQNYLAVKIHAGKQPQLANRYQVKAFPTDVFVTPSGLEVFRTVSPQKPEDYIAVLNQVAQQAGIGAARQWKSQLAKSSDGAWPPKTGGSGQQSVFKNQQSGIDNRKSAVSSGSSVQVASASSEMTSPAPQPDSQTGSANVATASTALTNQYQQATQSVLDRRSAFTPVEQSPATAGPATNAASAQAASPPAATPVPPPAVTSNPWIAAAPSANAAASHSSAPDAASAELAPDVSRSPDGSASVAAAQAAAQAAPEFPNHQMVPRHQAPPIALDGFCPVTLMEAMAQNRIDRSAWKKGDEKFGAIHEGRTYLFASAENQQKFLNNPAAYAPLLSGCDPVVFAERGQMLPGKRCYGLLTADRHMYLFADEASFNRFKQSPSTFTAAVQQAMARNQTTSVYR